MFDAPQKYSVLSVGMFDAPQKYSVLSVGMFDAPQNILFCLLVCFQ